MRRRGLSVIVASLITAASAGVALAQPAAAAPVGYSRQPITGVGTNGIVRSLLIMGDTVYVGGNFTQVYGPGGSPTVARRHLAAFDLHTGAVRTAFNPNPSGPVRALATDGTSVFAGGAFGTIGGQTRSRIASLDPTTGAARTAFQANTDALVLDLEVNGSRVFLGGEFRTVRGVARNRIAAVNKDTGVLDTAFNPNANHIVTSVEVPPDGSVVYAGGRFTNIGGGSRPYVVSLTPTNGTLRNPVFTNSTFARVLDLDLTPNGDRLYAALGDLQNQAIGWRTSDGQRLWRQIAMGDAQAVKYLDGNVYFSFHEGFQGDTSVKMLVADAQTGALENSYRLPINTFFGVWVIDGSSDALILGGEFTRVSNVTANRVAILPASSTPPPPPPQGLNLVAAGSTWRYLDTGADLGTAWRAPGYADGSWGQGPAQLGYGDGDEATRISFGPNQNTKPLTVYFRRQFTVANASAITSLVLRLVRDDGAVVYLNGVEVARSNMPAGTITYQTRAASNVDTNENQFQVINLQPGQLMTGTNTIAVEVHQERPSSSDLSFDLALEATTEET